MSSRQVTCVGKETRNGAVIQITHLGGQQGAGENWCLAAVEAIRQIERGETTFYVEMAGLAFAIHVGQAKGRKWLRTHHVPSARDYLWDLPDCLASECPTRTEG